MRFRGVGASFQVQAGRRKTFEKKKNEIETKRNEKKRKDYIRGIDDIRDLIITLTMGRQPTLKPNRTLNKGSYRFGDSDCGQVFHSGVLYSRYSSKAPRPALKILKCPVSYLPGAVLGLVVWRIGLSGSFFMYSPEGKN